MKKFCGIAAALTVMLCAAGCGDDSPSEIYLSSKGMNVAGKNQSPAAAAGGYRAGSSREILVTAGTAEKGAEGAEAVTSYVTEEDYSMRGNYGDGRSGKKAMTTPFSAEHGTDSTITVKLIRARSLCSRLYPIRDSGTSRRCPIPCLQKHPQATVKISAAAAIKIPQGRPLRSKRAQHRV